MAKHPLKEARELRGWSQAKVAEAVGTIVRTVSRWEQGKALPYPYYRERLFELFEKNAEQLGFVQRSTMPDIEIIEIEEEWYVLYG